MLAAWVCAQTEEPSGAGLEWQETHKPGRDTACGFPVGREEEGGTADTFVIGGAEGLSGGVFRSVVRNGRGMEGCLGECWPETRALGSVSAERAVVCGTPRRPVGTLSQRPPPLACPPAYPLPTPRAEPWVAGKHLGRLTAALSSSRILGG